MGTPWLTIAIFGAGIAFNAGILWAIAYATRDRMKELGQRSHRHATRIQELMTRCDIIERDLERIRDGKS